MSHKINFVHPTSNLISWMQTRSLILSIYNVLIKARFLQTSLTAIHSELVQQLLHQYLGYTWLNSSILTMTVADFIRIFRLPQATDNNHAEFVDAPTFSQMVPFYRNALGFSLTLRSPLNCVKRTPTVVADTGTHRITSAPRIPNPEVTEGESSTQFKPTVIRFCVPPKRQDPETPIPTSTEIDITNLDETLQMSIAIQRSIEDYKAQQNVAKVKEYMVDEELDQLLKGTETVDVDAFMDDFLNSQEDSDTRIKPKSDKESPKAEKDVDMVTIHYEEVEEGLAGDEFELRRREKEKDAPSSVDKEKLQELTVIDPTHSSSSPSSSLPKPKTGSAKRQKTSKQGTYSVGESSSEQAMNQEPNPSGLGTQEQLDEFDALTDGFATDDDEVPNEEVSQDL
ncbi:hypothetical protein Tco_1162776 [Tanacetum coccineum]